MKKRIFFSLLIASSTLVTNVFAEDKTKNKCPLNHEQKIDDGSGNSIPIFGNLNNLLPIAIVSFSFNKFPKQSVALLVGLIFYSIYNGNIKKVLRKLNFISKSKQKNKKIKKEEERVEFDDSFFVFDEDVPLMQKQEQSIESNENVEASAKDNSRTEDINPEEITFDNQEDTADVFEQAVKTEEAAVIENNTVAENVFVEEESAINEVAKVAEATEEFVAEDVQENNADVFEQEEIAFEGV